MTCIITIEMDNAAFEDAEELRRIIHELANKTRLWRDCSNTGNAAGASIPAFDINGNRVGQLSIE